MAAASLSACPRRRIVVDLTTDNSDNECTARRNVVFHPRVSPDDRPIHKRTEKSRVLRKKKKLRRRTKTEHATDNADPHHERAPKVELEPQTHVLDSSAHRNTQSAVARDFDLYIQESSSCKNSSAPSVPLSPLLSTSREASIVPDSIVAPESKNFCNKSSPMSDASEALYAEVQPMLRGHSLDVYLDEARKRDHRNNMRPAVDDQMCDWDESALFPIDRILAKRSEKAQCSRGKVTMYLVKWKGYGPNQSTWEHLDGRCREVRSFEKRFQEDFEGCEPAQSPERLVSSRPAGRRRD